MGGETRPQVHERLELEGGEMSEPTILYRPQVVSDLTVKEIEFLQNTRAQAIDVFGGVTGLFNPARPGNVVTFLGLSGNWKTGAMISEVRREAARLDPAGDEICLYVTWEDAVEELGILDVANETRLDVGAIIRGEVADWNAVKRAAVKRGTLPVYIIGHSLQSRKKRETLTMDDVAKAVYWLEDELKQRVKLAALDYLQIIPPGAGMVGQPKRIWVDDNAQRVKNMALALGCPVYMGCQAKQDVMERDYKLPRMNDGMETAGIMHVSNTIVSLWRPQTTDAGGSVGNPPMNVVPNLMVVGNAKQRKGETGEVAYLNVDFSTNTVLGKMDVQSIRLDD